jgi:hypothetical protein
MQENFETLYKLEEFVPSLRQAFEEEPLDLKKVILAAVPIQEPNQRPPVPDVKDRHKLFLSDGNQTCCWRAEPLQALFRGHRQPPILGDYPEAYNDSFLLMDLHALEFSKLFGDRRDAEMKEIYSSLRRRPDGKSLGVAHDYMWQGAAFVLGTRPLSQAEFEAIMERLERSCRTFERSPSSRNYITTLRNTIGQEGQSGAI